MRTTLQELYAIALQNAPGAFEAKQLLYAAAGQKPPFTDPAAPAPDGAREKLADLLARRAQGAPLQYLLGEWEFYSLPFYVGPGVLIPRQDTETLVDIALRRLRDLPAGAAPHVLDLCSGSGCVAVALRHNFPAAAVTAQEFSPEAYAYLVRNVRRHYPDIGVHLSDLREYTHPGPLDMVVSNPPYVPEGELGALQAELGYEPLVALNGGEDGLKYFRAIARRYRAQLRPGGLLLLEVGAGQHESVAAILTEWGYADIGFHNDLTGTARVIEGRKALGNG